MKTNYDQSLQYVLKDEGGYSNNPADPGGPTNFGITIADYRAYINPHATAADVRRMKLDDAKRIYRARYWDALGCDNLPSGVDYAIFDYGVNSGVGRAKRVLAKFAKITDAVAKINAICDERLAFLRSLNTFRVFGPGWTRRVAGVRTNAIKMSHLPVPVSKTVAGTVAATTVVTTAAVAAAPVHHLTPYFIFGGLIFAAIAGLAVFVYLHFKGKK